ncbi:hypothetical protein BDY17DRAFT_323761 [Neohortaea acidophila]|uniref:Exocyst complex component EXO84 n=1 Tax=Neohortaea acidophila TaxID=245834 RepID=A0A6A6PSY0_9PEZI|nr:uncharacterized protein BDY17DRAFT_323761 [Neohortaea acidophila]KAF2482995.1 hypothetical protein BDY17DRAFT_323761 [Neohortaea acidophila]
MSDEKSKGISLRRKKTTRPTISGPRLLSHTSQERDQSQTTWETGSTASGSNANLTVPGEGGRGGAGEKTSDLVKRRYSTRFAGGIPQPDGAVPSVPNIPTQYARSMRSGSRDDGDRSQSRDGGPRSPARSIASNAGRLQVDMRALKEPNLQPDKYIQSILSDATEVDIRAYVQDLQNVKDHASTDLQHNVFQNRTQFIKISQEADKLKSEMRTLRTLMGELTGALGQATSVGANAGEGGVNGEGSSSLSVADRKRANRSSVANLEAMWSSHLQTLWKRVEGSQKYLPALPGRHIIMESQRWVELNAATWKPRRRVGLVLLNDHLLVASEKKRKDLVQTDNTKSKHQSTAFGAQGAIQTTYVAERCWLLQDVSLADISSSASFGNSTSSRENAAIANAISIRAGNESFTYATSDNSEKAGFLVAFRKAQEDLRKLMAAEHGQRQNQLDELARMTGVRDPKLLKKAAAAARANDEKHAAGGLSRSDSILVDADGRQQSIRSVESQIDTLDIDIALQRFEEAVAKTEKLRKLGRSIRSNAAASEIILTKVNERASKLAASIARQLVQTSSATEKTKENVSWLLRLGFEEMARTRYLDSRTETIRLRTRQLPFSGALPPYLHAFAFTTFTLILHTLRTFSASFPASSGSSGVKWAKERVEEFNAGLERAISGVERGSELWETCLQVVRERAEVLREVSVDFRTLIGKNLVGEEASGKDGQQSGAQNAAIGLGVST